MSAVKKASVKKLKESNYNARNIRCFSGRKNNSNMQKTKIGEVLEVKNNNVDLKTKNFFVSYPRECFSESDIMFITIKENVLLDKHSMISFM